MPTALVSVDYEGLPYIVSPRYQLGPEGRLWSEARRIATRLSRAVAEELRELGYTRVIIADSHGLMVNIEPEALPRGTVLVAGFPRLPPSMTPLADEADVAIFLGYHARAGVLSALAHTYAGRYIVEVRVNGRPASEYLLNALYLGEKGVPVGLVAGSEELMDEVASETPWAVRLPLKKSLGFTAAASPSLEEVEEALRQAVREMDARLRSGRLKPLEPAKPVRMEITLTSPLYAQIASMLPGVEQVDGSTIAYTSATMEEAMRILELLLYAWIGAASLIR